MIIRENFKMRRERKRAMERTFTGRQRNTEENWDRDLKYPNWGETDID